jgi:hypothetical protein
MSIKCEKEGCNKESVHGISIHRMGGTIALAFVGLCDHHLADRVREYADEVEGVRICEECEGHGVAYDEIGGYVCAACHGTGRVKK